MTPGEAGVLALAAAGFALLVRASPLGRIPAKPFSCVVCLSGWGAILASGIDNPPIRAWLVASLVGTGGGVLLLALLDALRARAEVVPPTTAEAADAPPVIIVGDE